jgi:hypothetical protein
VGVSGLRQRQALGHDGVNLVLREQREQGSEVLPEPLWLRGPPPTTRAGRRLAIGSSCLLSRSRWMRYAITRREGESAPHRATVAVAPYHSAQPRQLL